MKKLISRCLAITCCAVIAVGLLPVVSFADAYLLPWVPPSARVEITTLDPWQTNTANVRVPFVAVISGDAIKVTNYTLQLDGVAVNYSMVTYTDPLGKIMYKISYGPNCDLRLGSHVYTLSFVYGRVKTHVVVQYTKFNVVLPGLDDVTAPTDPKTGIAAQ